MNDEIPSIPNATEPVTPAVPIAPMPSAPPAPAHAPAPERTGPAPTMAGGWHWGTGRRKSAVARVRIRPGSGQFFVNRRESTEYFPGERNRKDIRAVLAETRTEGSVDVHVSVRGGGSTGQAGAIVLGIARALNRMDPTLESTLRDHGFLTRDAREVERKKYGQAGARRRFQFSKR